jgi:hypothetical protein
MLGNRLSNRKVFECWESRKEYDIPSSPDVEEESAELHPCFE